MFNYPERIKVYADQRDELEERFVAAALALTRAPADERAKFSAQCFREAAQAEEKWLEQIEKVPARKARLNNNAWDKFNRAARIPNIS